MNVSMTRADDYIRDDYMKVCCCDQTCIQSMKHRIRVLNVISGLQTDAFVIRAVMTLQCAFRMHLTRRKDAITHIQSICRGWMLRYDKRICDRAAVLCQKYIRSYLTRRRLRKRLNAALKIQYMFRNTTIHVSARKLRKLIRAHNHARHQNTQLSNILIKVISFLS